MSIQKSPKWPIHLAFYFIIDCLSSFFSRKKITQCSKIFVNFILEGKWTVGGFSYTLSRAKSNGIIHFVLSLKLGSLRVFRRPPKTLYFLCNSFSLHRNENLITDSYSSGKNTTFLFKPFFSQVNNKRLSIYGPTIPLCTRCLTLV